MPRLPIIAGLRNRFGGESLKGRVLSGTAWTVAGYGGQQILRFGSNVVLTRLLFPEAFGLMLLINTIIAGLEMLSDVGIRAFLIQSRNGEDEKVLATAFTLKVIRGFFLWGVAAALAYPLSLAFQKPEVAVILPVVAASMAILGFRSNKILLASRNLKLARQTLMNLGAQVVTIVVMVVWAAVWPSVWALVAGTLVGGVVRVVASHLLFPGPPDRFGWDRRAAREMFRFGFWIFLSTILAYLAGQGDTLLLGRLLDAATLGVFGIAILLARVVGQGVNMIANSVLFPAYARVHRESPGRIRRVLYRTRSIIVAGGAVAYLPFVLYGTEIVEFVYDPRYHGAGWILQLLSCGFTAGLIGASYNGILHSKGMSYENTLLQAFQVAMKFTAMLFGFAFFGITGLILGVAFSSWLSYPVLALIMARAGVWMPRFDAVALGLAALGILLFFTFAAPEGMVF